MEKTIKEFAEENNITLEYRQIKKRPDNNNEWANGSKHFKCTLCYECRNIEIYYSQGGGIKDDPRIEDLLNCIISDNTDNFSSFEEFASEFGYDEDSRKAEKIYNACVEETKNAKWLLGSLYNELLDCEIL